MNKQTQNLKSEENTNELNSQLENEQSNKVNLNLGMIQQSIVYQPNAKN